MPKRTDIESILVIGSGPIVIGQACEFDYSGTQACRVLRAEGYRVILANSNPATIMTDPGVADRTYVEPLVADVIAAIIDRERPDALLPTLGGQTALNLAMELTDSGVLDAAGVQLIGANADAIRTAEDRDLFKEAMGEIGLEVPASGFATTLDEAVARGRAHRFSDHGPSELHPRRVRHGNRKRSRGARAGVGERARCESGPQSARRALDRRMEGVRARGHARPRRQLRRRLLDREPRPDGCSYGGLDHGRARHRPFRTVEYQPMRDDAFACIRRVGVETGGSNIQFAVNPEDGTRLVIEMNPRVSRSSALASKATGFPIAKIAARLAVGYTLDEITNDITRATPASFEPAIDYVVTKIPRWAFEKLPGAPDSLGTRMQSVGEVMAIGRTFPESLQKAIRSLEQGRAGLNADPGEHKTDELDDEELLERTAQPTPERVFELEAALRRGFPTDMLAERTGVDRWFLDQLEIISSARLRLEADVASRGGERVLASLDAPSLARAQKSGVLRRPAGVSAVDAEGRESMNPRCAPRGSRAGVWPTFKTVDTCAAEFEALTPYHYSTYEDEDEVRPSTGRRVVILGSGPEPDRPGNRVRLLLRPREPGAQGRGLRDRDGELQPGDGLDRLRHIGSPLLRAADGGGRAERSSR